MNRFLQLLLFVLVPISWIQAQEATIKVTENLTAEGIPAIPISIIDEVKNYTESRGASLVDWHPKRKELLIATRFANSVQLHHVKMAGGARTQMTFFSEPVSSAIFQPVT